MDQSTQTSAGHCAAASVNSETSCTKPIDTFRGGKRVKDILPDSQGTPFELIFEDGHTLPLLCPDCGRSLHVSHQNEDQVLNEVTGLYLVGLAYVEPEEGLSGLALLFSRDPNANLENPATATKEIVLHLDSARRLTCPDERTLFTQSIRNARPRKRSSRHIHR